MILEIKLRNRESNKETDILKSHKITVALKCLVNEMNALKSTGNWADEMEEKVGKLEERNLELTQVEERELRSLRSEETL